MLVVIVIVKLVLGLHYLLAILRKFAAEDAICWIIHLVYYVGIVCVITQMGICIVFAGVIAVVWVEAVVLL
jgi:hypothetical protein